MTPSGAMPIEILLVEDNPGDVRLTREALRGAKVRNKVHVAADGVEALALLRKEGGHTQPHDSHPVAGDAGPPYAPEPDLILLDLSLPEVDGRAVLQEIRRDERLRHIPVVVVSGSQALEDVVRSCELHANAYVTKPINPVQFLAALNGIEQFWLEIVKLR
jgi:chemotaxis family two-component system response regulator Rcp1